MEEEIKHPTGIVSVSVSDNGRMTFLIEGFPPIMLYGIAAIIERHADELLANERAMLLMKPSKKIQVVKGSLS